ncbi:MAG: XdhC family protein [Chitinophagaceae bacterium]
MELWPYINDHLNTSDKIILLWVLESEGSSPGRRGFKMAVSTEGFYGTIGGGIMEHKLVEKAKTLLINNETRISLVRQYHDKQHSKDQSGMICSGSQLIAFVPVSMNDKKIVESIVKKIKDGSKDIVSLTPEGISLIEASQKIPGLQYSSETEWLYTEAINQKPVIHIIGGGHVGLALSELMSYLGFYIKLYDNRSGLNTIEQNNFANEKMVVDYNKIDDVIDSNPDEYVVIMTFGYRDDKIVFSKLMDKTFFYIGMIGSETKTKTLFAEFEKEGINPARWEHAFIPIGLNIFSKTAKEIAVSIAAEIIREKNKYLPTGRRFSG